MHALGLSSGSTKGNGAALGQGGEIVVSAGDDGACLVFGTE